MEDAANVGFKRKAGEKDQIYNWHADPRAFEVYVKQYELDQDARRKDTSAGVKMVKGAEAKGIIEVKKAEAMVMKAEAMVMKIQANSDAIKIEADAIKIEADAKKIEADAKAKELENREKELELIQKEKAAGMDIATKKPDAGATRPKKPETDEERETRLAPRRARDAKKKAAKGNPPEPPTGAG